MQCSNNNLGLLLEVLNSQDFSRVPDDESADDLDQHGRFFYIKPCETSDYELISMQFSQGIAPETAIAVLHQAIALLETQGRELLNELPFGRTAGYLDCEGEIVWGQGPCQESIDEVIDHLPPEPLSDPDWLDDGSLGWFDASDDLDDSSEGEGR